MRHRNKPTISSPFRRRDNSLFKNLAVSLILHENVKTTCSRAKIVRARVERFITKAKQGNLTARRALLRSLGREGAVRKLLEELGPRYKERNGGYTRIVKLGVRKGDGADISQISFV
ncbi:MAG: 50S ribosomal protein L17 [Candidatus Jacksonbacteria bacterium RIFOXYA2_FULL_44_7]|uniref:50S ribosomal protein L17 n=1 Tax=Candidatus Jacksonbacteria bacterium RIFCSPLOWO2_02_FULL_44_20 TaxID=1798460 RepID=A0A1G2A9J2_9BACT|nr:MAG: 50S ribosomal protein L17 [Parcubacteria group bacterium GW2011_GWC2_44_17]KKT50235.1 MAG: 50S ribosomal protein L17 [Parcubacteria group bacterium GW2011_GWF2_44_17]OGY71233.1 MAG: 50S ribosomal protein L17 [Candidatus Jacksonbacteria bacterium RIFCSPHIGHO2_12_FULL_44_12]OGY71696.1 MAG: 50S ribosomal protein L17 [Candidatus Jacksonbacteria bacterium RIFCSPHIGHO2_02_FULL_44_25]OGY73482.1 MAG: 50S ribosomal protein L17 [Candidatus Jacksonbacteria bacterium RIFCSPLOWO2_02_FULL_44_20]OGY7